MIRLAILIAFVASTTLAQTTQPLNLASNGDLQIAGEKNLPSGWRGVTPWAAKGKFALDQEEKHSGAQSARISSDESTQSYLAGTIMPVAPGETFFVSGWVKAKDIQLGDNGKVQIQALIIRNDGSDDGVTVAALKLPKTGSSDWTHLEANFKVPPAVAKLVFRFGMHDATGTVWWDDLEIHPHHLLAARADLKGTRLSPALGGVPVVVMNRDQRKTPVNLNVQLGEASAPFKLDLSGEATQSVMVPLQFSEAGLQDCVVSLIGSDGKPIFSDKRKANVPRAMSLLPPIPSHWVKEDGLPQISGEIELAMTDEQRRGAIATVRLFNAQGNRLAGWTSKEALGDAWNHWDLKLPNLPLGDYKLIAELKSASGKTLTSEQHWHVIAREDAHVTLNNDGYLESKGKAIFPLGIFNGNGKLAEISASGFNVSHAYNALDVRVGQLPDDLRAQEFMDNTLKAGMKALFLVPREFVFHKEWENVRRRIRMFKNHPALLAWDEEEGLARGDMSRADLVTLRKLIQEEDPYHPLMVGDSRDGIRKVTDRSNFFPLSEMDLGMWWWYPLPLGGGKPSLLDGEEPAKALEMAPPSFLTLRNTDKPIWVGVQSYKKPHDWARYPTPLEYRAQAYLAVIHGAKGLMWYGGGVTGGIYGNLKDGHWDELKLIVKELSEISPVFMAATGEAPKFAPENAKLSVMLKKLPDRSVILAANRGSTPIDVTFDLPGNATVLFENRSITATGGNLKDRFEPYVVHVYELAK